MPASRWARGAIEARRRPALSRVGEAAGRRRLADSSSCSPRVAVWRVCVCGVRGVLAVTCVGCPPALSLRSPRPRSWRPWWRHPPPLPPLGWCRLAAHFSTAVVDGHLRTESTGATPSRHGMRVEPRERTIVMHAHGAWRSTPSTSSGAVVLAVKRASRLLSPGYLKKCRLTPPTPTLENNGYVPRPIFATLLTAPGKAARRSSAVSRP